MRRTWLLLLIALVLALVVLLFIAWSTGRLNLGSASGRQPDAPTDSIPTAILQQRPDPDNSIIADCLLAPIQYAKLGFQTPGLVNEILVAEGEQVTAGQVLARLGNRAELASALADAQNELLVAEQNLQSLSDGALLASAEAFQRLKDAVVSVDDADERLEQLIDDDGDDIDIAQAEARLALVRARQVDAQQRYDILKNGPDPKEIARQESSLAVAKAHLAAAEDALSNLELRAPFAGTVTDLDLRIGEMFSVGQIALLLVDQQDWQVQTTDLTEFNAVQIQPGDPATITFDALPEVDLPGVIRQVQVQGKDKDGEVVYKVLLDVEQLDPRLRWNMSCSVRIEGSD